MWRDGQKKRVFVYRFLSTGTIEEKVRAQSLVSSEATSWLLGLMHAEGGVPLWGVTSRSALSVMMGAS